MKNILERLLQKRGIKSLDELDKEERATFEGWQATLTKDELSTDDIRTFIKSQIDVIESKWADYSLDQDKKSQLIPYHTVYKMLLAAINSPASARDALEKNLNQLIQ